METTETERPRSATASGATYRVLLADPIPPDGLSALTEDVRFQVVARPGLEGAALAEAIEDADAVIVRSSTTITRESLASATRLKVIGRAGVGVDNIDVEAATERGVAVLNAPSGNTISAAELTMALLLAMVRRIPAADRSMRAGEWDRRSFNGIELLGKTLGLVGAGRIGGEVARRARVFGMKVLAYDPYLSEEKAHALEIELADLDAVLSQADVVSLHVPLTDATAGMLGAERLARMKKGAYLVNAARGGVVDEEALADALGRGHLAGAALDVYAEEPLPDDHPLRSLKNIVLTPHVGASTAEAQQNVAVEIAGAVKAALLDGDLSRAVNAPALSGEEMRRLRPLLSLGRGLGKLGAALLGERLSAVEVRLATDSDRPLRPVAAAVVEGVLADVVGPKAVNFVNAFHLAELRGIEVRRVKVPEHADYSEYLELRLSGAGGEIRVAGALLAQGFPRVVRVGDFHVDVVPRGSLVVLRNRDVPGVIGRVGTVLGDAGVNIAEYHQARRQAGGEALAAISVDGRLSAAVLDALRGLPEVTAVTQVELE